jgi:hypothetical protein
MLLSDPPLILMCHVRSRQQHRKMDARLNRARRSRRFAIWNSSPSLSSRDFTGRSRPPMCAWSSLDAVASRRRFGNALPDTVIIAARALSEMALNRRARRSLFRSLSGLERTYGQHTRTDAIDSKRTLLRLSLGRATGSLATLSCSGAADANSTGCFNTLHPR